MGMAMQNLPNANPGVAAGPMRSGWMGALQKYGGQAISNSPQGMQQPAQMSPQVTTNPMTRNVQAPQNIMENQMTRSIQPISGKSYAAYLRR